jgi:hypothetical protein
MGNLKTGEPKRHFKVLLEKRTDPDRKSAWRTWSLVDRMAERLPACDASRAIYHSELWGWLAGAVPTIEALHERIERELGVRGYFRPTDNQAQLFTSLIPESQLFSWTADDVLAWMSPQLGDSLPDVTLVAALVLEASLAGAWDVFDRWIEPLRSHIARFSRQSWLQSDQARPEAEKFERLLISGLVEEPKVGPTPINQNILGVIRRPIVEIWGDAEWFLRWEGQLAEATTCALSFFTHEQGAKAVASLMAKRAESLRKNPRLGFYNDPKRARL